MNVAAHRAVGERDKGLAQEHLTQADTKEQTILIDASCTEHGKMKRIGNEGVGKKSHAIVQMTRRVFFYLKHCRPRRANGLS